MKFAKILIARIIDAERMLKSMFMLIKLMMHDAFVYASWSSTFSMRGKERVEARIMAYVHTVEKAFSLKETKEGFGKNNVRILLGLMGRYRKIDPEHDLSTAFLSGMGVVNKYIKYMMGKGERIDEIVRMYDLVRDGKEYQECGSIIIDKREILDSIKIDFNRFIKSRRSIRNFTNEDIPLKIIEKAIALAQNAPSVCNRQSVRIHVISELRMIEYVLECQGGAKGFSQYVNKLLLVNSNLNAFHGPQERNQSFVDAGIYSMLLLLSLHSLGLGACALCWFPDIKKERLVKNKLKIDDNELIVLCIAVGVMPETVVTAESKRYGINKIFKVH